MFSSATTTTPAECHRHESVRYPLIPEPAQLHVCESRKPRQTRTEAERIDLLLSKVLSGDPLYRRHCRRIIGRQARLKLHVSRVAWGLYLSLEEAEIQRLTYALDLVAAKALARGRRSRGRRSRGR